MSLNKLSWWVNKADIVFWNGALGITEHPFYKNGSEQLVHLLGQCPGDVVIGGGDTAGFVQGAGTDGEDFTKKYDFFHISTGGGASIDYLTSETLPGIAYYEKGSTRPRGASDVDKYRLLAIKGRSKRKPSLDDLESPPVRACDLEPPAEGDEVSLLVGWLLYLTGGACCVGVLFCDDCVFCRLAGQFSGETKPAEANVLPPSTREA